MTIRLEKPVRRFVKIRGLDYLVELAAGGILFKRKGTRRKSVAPLVDVLRLAEEHRQVDERRELVRRGAIGRMSAAARARILLVTFAIATPIITLHVGGCK